MNPALLALFATDQPFEQFDLYTITLTSGLVLRYANCPFEVKYNGQIWRCPRYLGVPIDEDGDSGPRAHWTSDFSVGTWSVVVLPRPTDKIGSLPWLWAVKAGILDEAIIRVDRGYVLSWPSVPTLSIVPIGLVNVFFGRTAEIDFGRGTVTINMNDMRELLAIQMPRNLYSAPCRYALFGPGCTLNKASYGVNVTVSGQTGNQLITTTATQSDDYFSLGSMKFTSGANAGLELMVRQSISANGQQSLIAPFPFTIQNGDAATLYPGCDKTQTTCSAKFSNLSNFGGFPYIPAAETSL
jgi:hypothetical protein